MNLTYIFESRIFFLRESLCMFIQWAKIVRLHYRSNSSHAGIEGAIVCKKLILHLSNTDIENVQQQILYAAHIDRDIFTVYKVCTKHST